MDMVNLDFPLQVNSCGIYRLVKREIMATTRPGGRRDYQLLYVSSGKARFHYRTGTETHILTAPAGSIMLYRPSQMQYYEYHLEDTPEVCWIHFTGSDADRLLDKIGFSDTPLLQCSTDGEYRELFRHMIRELQLKRPCHEDMLALQLRQLFCLIHRDKLELSSGHYTAYPEITEAIHFFNEAFPTDISIDAYAASLHISTCWFIRRFKQVTGVTPLQYITMLRINKAKKLLRSSQYSVQEIANILGYDDPLYFSRIFKKQTGRAPSQYQNRD